MSLNILIPIFGGGVLIAALMLGQKKKEREKAEMLRAEELGEDAVKQLCIDRLELDKRMMKAVIYSALFATISTVAVLISAIYFDVEMFYEFSLKGIFGICFSIPLIILLVLVRNTDFISLSNNEKATVLKKYYVSRGLTENGLTYEEATRRREEETARRAEESELRRKREEAEAEAKRAQSAKLLAEATKTKAEADAEALRIAEAEAERRKREEAEATERAFWASPEGQKVRAAQMQADIERQKALDLANIRIAEQERASELAEKIGEAQRKQREAEMEAVKNLMG